MPASAVAVVACSNLTVWFVAHVHRIRSGAVARAQLELWLQQECREVLQAVNAATMLDLLSSHTYGEGRTALRATERRRLSFPSPALAPTHHSRTRPPAPSSPHLTLTPPKAPPGATSTT